MDAWTYHSVHETGELWQGKKATLHLWERPHRDGYTAYAMTHQPHHSTGLDYVKPSESGHYVGEDGLLRRTGIRVS